MRAVTGADYPGVAAVLEGYERRTVRGEVYPAIRSAPGSRTRGVLYRGIGPDGLARLDAFEGALYERVSVMVDTPRGALPAWTYVLAAGQAHRLSGEEWDLDSFLQRDIGTFTGGYTGFGRLQPAGGASVPGSKAV